MKNKYVAASLALTLGIYGAHRFYLGQRMKGVLHFLLGMFSIAILIEEGAPLIILPAIIAVLDAVLLFVMPKEEFDDKYNYRRKFYQADHYEQRPASRKFRRNKKETYTPNKSDDTYKRTGIAKYNNHDYEGAIEDFKRSLKNKYEDPSVHFNLACCYSICEETMMSLFHLDKAIEFGFVDFDKIHSHNSLSFLRTTYQFEDFVDNSYQLPRKFEQVEEELEKNPEGLELENLVEQIKRLGELRDKGILTEEEFQNQKKKLL